MVEPFPCGADAGPGGRAVERSFRALSFQEGASPSANRQSPRQGQAVILEIRRQNATLVDLDHRRVARRLGSLKASAGFLALRGKVVALDGLR